MKKQISEVVFCRCSSKCVFLKIAQILQVNSCITLVLVKLQTWRPATLLKRDFNTGNFSRNLKNDKENIPNNFMILLFKKKWSSHINNGVHTSIEIWIWIFIEGYLIWNTVSHHGWPTKKFFDFKSSKRARKI